MARIGLLKAVVLLLDLLGLTIGLWGGHRLWVWYKPHLELLVPLRWWELWLPTAFSPGGLVLACVWLLVMRQVGLYDPDRMTSSARIASGVSRAAGAVLVAVVVLQFLQPEQTYSRTLLAGTLLATAAAIGALRLAFFRVNAHVPKPIVQRRLAIVGVGEEARAMADRLQRRGRDWVVCGYLRPLADSGPGAAAEGLDEDAVLGSITDVRALVNAHDLQVLILASRALSRQDSLILATEADRLGLRVLQVPLSWGIASPRIDLARVGDLQLIDITSLAYPTFGEQLKRGIDLVLVGLGGALLLPLLTLVGLLVKLQDGGPVFFVQQRVGRGGRTFPFFKFRSMVVDAEQQRAALEADNEADGVLFKMAHDPRITPLGRFIRKYSIDELPQLWNVLRGDMNLVGPRPLPLSDLEGAEDDAEVAYWMEMRQKVRPGITGPWQVSGRSNLGFEAMVNHDIAYVQEWSLWLDIVILFKTVPAVLRGRGAR
ncbi:MAG: exopolysaccharide biosynthesis polyprenyl glycosylphosphotransferase [Alphaproteobacteria bacterium]|nr:exopolysaccharide biosynthesis polyprenyl glycosylphosphotransferase [Alphaproteobacteria bacterium]